MTMKVELEGAWNDRALLGWRVLVNGVCVGLFREFSDAEHEYSIWRKLGRR